MMRAVTVKMSGKGPRANALDDHFGWRIREARALRGMNSQQLASALRISNQQLHKYEHGVNRVTASRLFEIARVLDLPILFFFAGMTPAQQSVAGPRVSAESLEPEGTTTLGAHEARGIIRAFSRIKDAKLRKRMLAIIKLSGTAEPES